MKKHLHIIHTSIFISVTGLAAASNATAADWPQWMGPNRNGISHEAGLLKTWPTEGPRLMWHAKNIGSGYGGPSISDGRVFITSNEGLENESVIALSVINGSRLWATRIGKVGNPDQRPSYPAARSTPTVDGTRVYALGSDGDLACLDSSTGEIAWTKNLRAEFAGEPSTWAYAESPLIDGDVVVCTPGGEEATVVALNKQTGEVVWKTLVPGGDAAGYSSIVKSTFGEVSQFIAYTAGGLVSVNANTGDLLWRYDRIKGSMGMSIMTPVTGGDIVFGGAGRVGGGAVRMIQATERIDIEEAYFNTKLPTEIGGALMVDGHLYGSSGQTLVCADFKTGAIRWEERIDAPGALIAADQRLYLYGENGRVSLIEASPSDYRVVGQFTPADGPEAANRMEKTWAYPAISNGRLYIRNKNSLWSYDIATKTPR